MKFLDTRIIKNGEKSIAKYLFMGMAMFSFAMLSSCSKDDKGPEDIPVIADFSVENNSFVDLNGSVSFSPSITNDIASTYSWTVNGKEVSTDKDYTFTPSAYGSYEIKLSVTNALGKAEKSVTLRVAKYHGGFFIISEGAGGITGTVNYYDPAAKKVIEKVNEQEGNSTSNLGKVSQYGTIHNNTLYVTSKNEGIYLTAFNIFDMAVESRLDMSAYSNNASPMEMGGYAFVPVDDNYAVFTTTQGAFQVSLNPLSVVKKLEHSGSTTQEAGYDWTNNTPIMVSVSGSGNAVVSDGNIFVSDAAEGILVYSAADFSYKQTLNIKATGGMVKGNDGNIWVIDNSDLTKINPQTFASETVSLTGVSLSYSWDYKGWKAGQLTASSKGNVLYMTEGGYSPVKVYRYEMGSTALPAEPLIEIPAGWYIYGCLAEDSETGDIVVLCAPSDYSAKNRVMIFSAEGEVKETIDYGDGTFYYSAMSIFYK